jgi:membrane-bound lytic murein transglycosylase A
MRPASGGLALALAAVLGACSGRIVPLAPAPVRVAPAPVVASQGPVAPRTAPTPSTATSNAVRAGVVAGADFSTLGVSEAAAQRALVAFKTSCPALQRRPDLSGLTRAGDWAAACSAAAGATDASGFFAAQFETIKIGSGAAFATGYYEPEIAGSRTRDAANAVPVYGKPSDLVELDLGDFAEALKGKAIRGRISGGGFVPYFDRTEIENGALSGRAPVIAYAADSIEFFFLQVQGSGRLRLPDGSIMRIGYNSQNGRDYTGIGALMRDRGLVGPGQLSMQGIMAWLRAHPEEGQAIMRENKSFVFFRELTGAGAIGALNVPVTARVSVAADPAFMPLGAPVWLDLDRNEADGLWVAQDTGGAIKGANRVDTFWGAGDEARRIAGGMSGRGIAYVLVPKGTIARLQANGTPAQP